MLCDIFLIVFSYERGDSSMFYAIPEGKGMTSREVLAIEDAFKKDNGYHRPLIRFQRLDSMHVNQNHVGRILDRVGMKKIILGA